MRPFTYQKAATAADAVSAIAAGGAGTRFLAGGTTLYDLMKLNVEVPSHIVDINSLSELEAFDTSGSNELVFGLTNVAPEFPHLLFPQKKLLLLGNLATEPLERRHQVPDHLH